MAKKQGKFSLSLFILLLVLATLAGILVFSASISKIRSNPATPQSACGVSDILSQTGEFDSSSTTAVWLGETVTPLTEELALSQPSQLQDRVLGNASGEKWIEVDLTHQRVKAHQGDTVIYEFPMSSGKFAPTPTGQYRIWYKVKYTKMEGGKKGTGTYYYLPNVPFTMFFYQGYGLHGTYWHNNFGTPMSHGCVNLSISNAEKIFNWAGPAIPEGKYAVMASDQNPGTRVVVHGRTPRT